MAQLKLGGWTKNCQTAKLKSPPNKLYAYSIIIIENNK